MSAFNVEGRSFGSKRLRADVTLRAGATGLAEYEVLSRLDLRPGRYQLRIAANVGSLSTGGSLYYDVDVPDVGSTPLAMSGLMLGVEPGPVVAPADGLKPLVPILPTTRRRFVATDHVTLFARLHQSGKASPAAVPLRLTIRNASNVVVVERLHDVGAAAFGASRFADVVLEVPIGRLLEGQHLLTIEAGAGPAAIRKHSRFEIAR